jgi:putative transposase
VLTEVGPVQLDVPRDREGSFTPQIVRKRQRRLTVWTGSCCRCRRRG